MAWWRNLVDEWDRRAERVGIRAVRMLLGVQRFNLFTLRALTATARMQWLRRPAVMNVLVRQIYFTGVQGLPWVAVLAVLAGVSVVYQIVIFAKGLEDLTIIGLMVSEVVVQEMAPLLVMIILLARSGVAIVTEIGNMHVRSEDLLLRSLGVDERDYLYVPRMLAFALCGVILTFFFVGIAVWLGGLAVARGQEMQFTQFLFEARRGTTLAELLLMTFKGLFYPLISCAVLLYQGCRVGLDPNRIPVQATNGVLGALMTIILIDVVIVFVRNVT